MATADTARLLSSLSLDTSGFDAGVRRAGSSLGGLERRMGKIGSIAGQGARNAGRNIERGLVVGIGAAAGALTFAAKAAIDWESAFTGVRKTVDATAKTSLPQLEEQLLGLARTMPITSDDLAQIAENAGAMGIKADDIAAFTKQVAILGATTDVSTDQASIALGQLQNVIGLTGDEFDNFAATLVDLGNKGASTESQILEIARRSGGAANLFGIAKDEMLGWASAAANLGLNEELAGTALQNVFIKLLPQFINGTKTLREVTGLTGDQLKKSFQQDAGGALESLIKKLGEMPKDARLKAVQALFGKSSGITRLVLGLADSYDKNLKPSLDESVKAWKEATAAQQEYDKRSQTTQAQLQILGNNVKIAAATIGKELLPVLIDIAKEGVAWLDAHQAQIKEFAQKVGSGARDAVKWLKSVNWSGVIETLKAGAGFGTGLVKAFLGAPPWLQSFLATGFIANKFTGGAVVSITGELGKGLLGGFVGALARAGIGKAFVQPVFVVNPGFGGVGGGGVAGAVGKGGAGALATGLSVIAAATAVAMAIEVYFEQKAGIATVSSGVQASNDAMLANSPSIDDMKQSLRGIDEGIDKIQSNPLNMILGGDALKTLQDMRGKTANQLGEVNRWMSMVSYGTGKVEAKLGTANRSLDRIEAKRWQIVNNLRINVPVTNRTTTYRYTTTQYSDSASSSFSAKTGTDLIR